MSASNPPLWVQVPEWSRTSIGVGVLVIALLALVVIGSVRRWMEDAGLLCEVNADEYVTVTKPTEPPHTQWFFGIHVLVPARHTPDKGRVSVIVLLSFSHAWLPAFCRDDGSMLTGANACAASKLKEMSVPLLCDEGAKVEEEECGRSVSSESSASCRAGLLAYGLIGCLTASGRDCARAAPQRTHTTRLRCW